MPRTAPAVEELWFASDFDVLERLASDCMAYPKAYPISDFGAL
jgi:hypothetical protein